MGTTKKNATTFALKEVSLPGGEKWEGNKDITMWGTEAEGSVLRQRGEGRRECFMVEVGVCRTAEVGACGLLAGPGRGTATNRGPGVGHLCVCGRCREDVTWSRGLEKLAGSGDGGWDLACHVARP